MKSEIEMQELYLNAKKHLWYDTYSFQEESNPIVGVKGEGGWFKDLSGNEYFEAMSGHSCLNLGYGRVELAQVAYEQMVELAYFSPDLCNIPAVQLASKLSNLLDDSYVAFFSTSGSEANEVALKIARHYHIQNGKPEKHKFISHYRGYHGGTSGAQSISATPAFKGRFDSSSPGFVHVLPPYSYRCPFGDAVPNCDLAVAELIDQVIRREQADTVAGLIVEPFLFAGGCIIPSNEYLTRLSEICKEHDILLIVDEVITGFGRTGKMFGYMHSENVQPDIVTMAKGLTSAYSPLGATMVSEKIYSKFKEEGNHLKHFSTMGGNPVSCAVALKNIEIMERENLVEQVSQFSKSILSQLHELTVLEKVGEVRGIGYLYGIEFVEDKESKTPVSEEFTKNVAQVCKKKGLIVGQDENMIRINPPLSSTAEDLSFVVHTLKSVLNDLG